MRVRKETVMPKIHELGFELANMIAAGEVVSRPASAIKELVENSIDAGADRITVEIHNGGVLLMRVSDNGCGMDPEDLVMCVKRHATSKIRSASDIDAITTMGFRGEALAALSAVTELRIISKTEDAEYGHMLTVEYGEVKSIGERGAGKGTTVIAENLFMNMPARRKFLKRDITEAGAVIDCVEKLALSHPNIAFKMISDGVSKLETSGNGRLDEVIFKVYGRENSKNMIKINGEHEGVRIYGFIGSPLNHKVNRSYQTFFVNKRSVTSPMMSTALSQAFTSYIPSDRFPVGVLFVEVNPLMMDVNVHPSKQEVKFVNESSVFGAIYHTCADALADMCEMPSLTGEGKEKTPEVKKPSVSEAAAPLKVNTDSDGLEFVSSLTKQQLAFLSDDDGDDEDENKNENNASDTQSITADKTSSLDKAPPREEERFFGGRNADKKENTADDTLIADEDSFESGFISRFKDAFAETGEMLNNEEDSPSDNGALSVEDYFARRDRRLSAIRLSRISSYRIVGELFNKYIMVETQAEDRGREKSVLMIDKHAAHERMIFERMKENLISEERPSQMLIVPVVADVGIEESDNLRKYKEDAERFGFKTETDGKQVKIWSVPIGVDCEDAEEMLLTLLSYISSGIRGGNDIPEIFDESLFVMACKAAVKGGRECDSLTVEAIVKAVITDPKIRFCPHGRPVVYEMRLSELDAKFKR